MTTPLETLIHEQTKYTMSESSRIAIEKIAQEIAVEALNDEEFRRALRAQVRAAARRIMADLTRDQGTTP
jgi:histidinol-phosphate/aromatic aminotransferase/cobyric acid decarboxylase-like protein